MKVALSGVPAAASAPATPEIGFDVHGIVGIALRHATPADVRTVGAQLGLAPGPLSGPPAITIEFVDRLPLTGTARLVGLNDAAFTDEAFFVLRGRHKSRVLVRIPMERIGAGCEITCERGLSAVPYLMAIVNMTVLARGGLPLHATAFRYGGAGVLVTGWSKGGKTEVLLAFTEHGAEYIGDEWIYVYGDRMRGVPEPVRVWDWHLEQLPSRWRQLRLAERVRLRALRAASAGMARVADGPARRGSWARHLNRLRVLLDSQRYTHLTPERMFGAGAGGHQASIDTVIFVGSHDAPETTIARVSAREVADRMAFSLQEERAELMSCYRKFRFAFPHRSNPLFEQVETLERERLHRALDGRPCYVVLHPYPPSMRALFDTIQPVLRERGTAVLSGARR